MCFDGEGGGNGLFTPFTEDPFPGEALNGEENLNGEGLNGEEEEGEEEKTLKGEDRFKEEEEEGGFLCFSDRPLYSMVSWDLLLFRFNNSEDIANPPPPSPSP